MTRFKADFSLISTSATPITVIVIIFLLLSVIFISIVVAIIVIVLVVIVILIVVVVVTIIGVVVIIALLIIFLLLLNTTTISTVVSGREWRQEARKRGVPVPPPVGPLDPDAAAPIARGADSPAPAEQGAFAPNYRMRQDVEAHERADIAVEIDLEPFGFPGLQACFVNLGIPYLPCDDKGWQERLERIIFHPIGRVKSVREVGYWLFRQVYSIKTVELVTIPLAPNGPYHRHQFDGNKYPRFGIAQHCYHTSERMEFRVKMMLRQRVVLLLVIIYLIYQGGVEIYTARKSVKEVAEVALQVILGAMAGLGALYSVLQVAMV
ncbi:hypothetical protein AOL_s00078g607 [Orbilia oligospora ATCC 24927]|uniref:Uncharacterized protein n=1 Tax=Arthrobotrys oligospora (strain ATCC 24927 / CBS 115.81 / DSM 1491) TaxID=756982 RepID=G1XCG0_ARTOA|nr:hypothetical protein AOL_s00078g607 [Orbilia oligospora ATCC 24927]EGX49223.1 hypothetical protein AOL_s00078g607 [Orbilia oligospora ATCC 24927]